MANTHLQSPAAAAAAFSAFSMVYVSSAMYFVRSFSMMTGSMLSLSYVLSWLMNVGSMSSFLDGGQ